MNINQKRCRVFSFIALCSLLCCACAQEQDPRQENTVILQETTEGTEKAKEAAEIPDLSKAGNADEVLALLIEDEGFRECVRYGIGIEEEDLAETVLQKMESCKSLVVEEALYGNAVYSLESLSLFPNLKQLVVEINEWDDSSIADFSPIAQMSELEQLHINYEKDEQIDLTFLGDMHTITELYLTRCKIEDFSFLEQMGQLQRLSLYKTTIEDLAVLEKLPGLVELSLAGNENAKHMEAVGTLTNMQDLGIQYCGVEDIGFLSGLKELRGLNLNGNLVTDITPLAGLEKLERLGLSENGISDISSLEGLTNLYDLALDGNEIWDISALTKLSRLNQVGISDNQIEDFSPLAGKEELMYAAVFGNPAASITPVCEVPQLLYTDKGVSDEEETFIAEWLKAHYPEAVEFECIDFVWGDLNDDGRQDVAFVVDSSAFDVYEEEFLPDDRRLFILLQQKDGSWKEQKDVPQLPNRNSGGMRGDPYYGAFMEAGCLFLKTGGGSSSGFVETEIYEYRNGNLCLIKRISVDDYSHAKGYDVHVEHVQSDTWISYVIAMDGYRMIRVDLADSEHPQHKAFPNISLFEKSYYVYRDKIATQTMPFAALDHVCATVAEDAVMAGDAAKEELPYTDWQKEGYELLTGVTVPEYYYVLTGTKKSSDAGGSDWEGDYMYYDGLTVEDGVLYHVICLEQESGKRVFLLDDATGELKEKE